MTLLKVFKTLELEIEHLEGVGVTINAPARLRGKKHYANHEPMGGNPEG